MTVTREQVLRGLAEYITREVVPTISDIPIKLAAGALVYRLHNATGSIAPQIFDNPAVKFILAESADGIDLDASLNGVMSSLQSYGNLVLTIPPIPLMSKQEHTLTFTSQDIDKLKQYIGGA